MLGQTDRQLEKERRKLYRYIDANRRMRETLERPTIPVSKAASDLVRFCMETPDPMLDSSVNDGPYGAQPGGSCCVIL
ncbi:hypothetical protein HDU76_006078 [Blyttiomyces sp. JEL0837]|nr:hypothetical protein HDU76_006078 [Blyttiomyces sp. JEL0837]